MARVSSITQQVRDFTGGLDHFEVDAVSVRALIRALDVRFPGLGRHVADKMSIAIDGEIHQDVLTDLLEPDSEVVLIPRIAGG